MCLDLTQPSAGLARKTWFDMHTGWSLLFVNSKNTRKPKQSLFNKETIPPQDQSFIIEQSVPQWLKSELVLSESKWNETKQKKREKNWPWMQRPFLLRLQQLRQRQTLGYRAGQACGHSFHCGCRCPLDWHLPRAPWSTPVAHTDSNMKSTGPTPVHLGLGCVTVHWHQQEHQGMGCVTTH